MRRKYLPAAFIVAAIALLLYSPVGAVAICPLEPVNPEGAAVMPITASYQVVGVMQQGSVSHSMETMKEKDGNLTGTELYTSSLFGKGGVSFATETSILGTTINGQQAAALGNGRITGSSGAYVFSATPHANLSSNANETDIVPYCSRVETVSSYDITKGQLAIQSTINLPMPGTVVTQEFAIKGDGIAQFVGKYQTAQGFGIEQVDTMTAKTRMVGTGLELAGKFDYLSVLVT